MVLTLSSFECCWLSISSHTSSHTATEPLLLVAEADAAMTELSWPADDGGDSIVRKHALDTLLDSHTADLPEWQETEWGELLKLGPDAFARALQQAEHDIEYRKDRDVSQTDASSVVDSSVFKQWTQRISHLQILDVSDSCSCLHACIASPPSSRASLRQVMHRLTVLDFTVSRHIIAAVLSLLPPRRTSLNAYALDQAAALRPSNAETDARASCGRADVRQ